MKYLRIIILCVVVSATVLIPFGLIAAAFTPGLPWWGRLSLVSGGLLTARLVKPFSIVTGKDLKII
ncbi:MAG: hypothetical protein HDS44_00590 [Bacteroides sp.]|nr:hypothetical protein [Bacteroides sp.]